jgi:hypothetical protein
MLSADDPLSSPDVDSVATPFIDTMDVSFDAGTASTPRGFSPSQIAAAYGFSNVVFNGNVKGDGTGTTIAIVDAYNDPNIAADLAKFDTQFGLAAPPSLTVVNQTGGTALPTGNTGWAMEIALDVEWAHAVAPNAKILLVEANSSSMTDLMKAVDYARNYTGVNVVSMSWGGSEFSTEASYDSHFTTPSGHGGVTFVVSAGDSGAIPEYPSTSPDVISVGGTSLTLNSSGAWSSETVWSGGGGGTSRYEARPSYQSSVPITGTHRMTPDISYDANPSTGFAVYDSYGEPGWLVVGGTSAGAPQIAAMVAIADQGRALAGKTSLANAQSALYSLSKSDFHDVTSGSDGQKATAGYDLASGLGTPLANLVIRDLVSFSGSTNFSLQAQPAPRSLFDLLSLFGFRAEDAGDGSAGSSDLSSVDGLFAQPSGVGLGGGTSLSLVPSATGSTVGVLPNPAAAVVSQHATLLATLGSDSTVVDHGWLPTDALTADVIDAHFSRVGSGLGSHRTALVFGA